MLRILRLIDTLDSRVVCFWDVDLRAELLLSKALSGGAVRLIDVSPGTRMYEPFNRLQLFMRDIAFDAREYFSSLHGFVVKHNGDEIPSELGVREVNQVVIKDGVHAPSGTTSLVVRPASVDPRYAVVACCRIVPTRLIEILLDVAFELKMRDPRISLTIVGNPANHRLLTYWTELQGKHRRLNLGGTVFFVDKYDDDTVFLADFKACLSLSREQGSPNAPLETMICGLPAITTRYGRTAEQVIDGITGFLVADNNMNELAKSVKWCSITGRLRKQ